MGKIREEMEKVARENAIKELKELQIDIGSSPDDLDNSPLYYALDIAIQALEQQPCEDCISREQAVYVASGYCAPQNIADELRKLPSVTPTIYKMEQVEDCISRDAVEKITWEEPSYDDALNVLTEVRDKVRALSSVKPEIKWIPVSEKLPNSYEYILATMISPVTQLPFVNKIYTGENAKEKIEEAKVMAWMALPKPYKGEQENG